MDCCNNTYNLGCFNHCSSVRFSEATETKTLTGIFTFAKISRAFNVPIISGQPYTIDLSVLNENADYTLRLYNADGSRFLITIGEIEYDCFEFSTIGICCDKSINLGCFTFCGDFILPYNATETGEHTVLFVNEGIQGQPFVFDAISGNPFTIDISNFNESGVTTFQIQQPSGTLFTVTLLGVIYSCFRLKRDVIQGIGEITPPQDENFLLQEDGFYLLQEDGFKIIL